MMNIQGSKSDLSHRVDGDIEESQHQVSILSLAYYH